MGMTGRDDDVAVYELFSGGHGQMKK